MDKTTFESLANTLDIPSDFIQKVHERFNPKDETELIKLLNEVSQLKEEAEATDEDALDYLEFQNEQLQQSSTRTAERAQKDVSDTSDELPADVPPALKEKMAEVSQEVRSGQSPDTRYDPKNVGATGQSKTGATNDVVSKMFGQTAKITQGYGNYNPELEPRSGINWGTDFVPESGGVGSPIMNPFGSELEVVKVVDGHEGGSVGRFDQNQGYGNQVIVRRKDTGEILQLSHLNRGIGVKQGDVIQPGQQFAQMGSSGNVTGPHLDLEVFDQSGKVKDVASLDKPNLLQPFAKQPTRVSEPEEVKPQAPELPTIERAVEQPQKKEYTVMQGDTPAKISQRLLGDSNRWKEFYKGDPNRLQVGTKIPMPG